MIHSSFWISLLAGSSVILSATASSYVPGGYIVEFEETHDSANFFTHVENTSDTRKTFDSPFFRGASIQFHDLKSAEADAQSLLKLKSVKSVWPITRVSLPDDTVIWKGHASDFARNVKRDAGNDTFSPHVMTQVDKLRAKGYIGKGIKIGVIDSGIDYNHPALGGGFGPGHLVSYGTDLVGDDYTGLNFPKPDDDPVDNCQGHGTHVAGIIAAQTNPLGFTGAAPGVTLGAYRVFGCTGSAGNDVLIDAFLKAAADGSNIITASIGGPSGWSEDPWSVVVSRIVESGIPCTISAGNDGTKGLFFTSTAANGKKVMAIGSFDNSLTPVLLIHSNFTVDGGNSSDFGYALGTPGHWAGVNLPLWTPSFNTSDPAMGCTPYPANTPDLSGKIVLVRRGTCTFVQKATYAAQHGAKYIMYYNNIMGAAGVEVQVEGINGTGMVTPEQGAAWVKLLAAGSEVKLNFLDPLSAPITLSQLPNAATGGFPSSFTTWGPTFEADIKPQLASPGGQILSTYPMALGSYAVISGTSMSCPLVAAIVALVSEVRGTLEPAILENMLSAYSKSQLYYNGQAKSSLLAPVAQQGPGLIQAYDAAYGQTLLSVSSLSFNDTDNLVDTKTFIIKNVGNKYGQVEYCFGSVAAATAYTFSDSDIPDPYPGLATDDSSAIVTFDQDKVTLSAGQEATIKVKVVPPRIDGSKLPVYSGYIFINGTNGENLVLPYQGIVGSLHDTKVLDSVVVSISTDPDSNEVPGNSSFTIPLSSGNASTGALPVAAIYMAFGSPAVHVEAISLGGNGTSPAANSTGKSLGEIGGFPLPWAPRGPLTASWNGSLVDGTFAPAGLYRFAVSALHIFGNYTDPEEYDMGLTDAFTIRYT